MKIRNVLIVIKIVIAAIAIYTFLVWWVAVHSIK
jgi:hypothetical protein